MTNKKRVLVLGSTGMLGCAVGHYFEEHSEKYDTVLSYRNKEISYGRHRVYFDALQPNFDDLPACDYIINCVGIIKPFMKESPLEAIQINSVFPWKLANHCQSLKTKLIHITTDCVYSGVKGQYTEADTHDALDDYGKSKSLGEPTNCMVLRTSIVGEEIHKKASLVEWVKSQKGKEVNGFVNHDWNGITTKQYAKICGQIITNDLYEAAKFHIFSPDSVNKCELVSLLSNKYNLGLFVNKYEALIKVDRTLSTTKDLCFRLDISSIKQQIKELK